MSACVTHRSYIGGEGGVSKDVGLRGTHVVELSDPRLLRTVELRHVICRNIQCMNEMKFKLCFGPLFHSTDQHSRKGT